MAVDRDRLAGAGGAGDQQVGHAGEVGDHRVAADVLAEREREVGIGFLEVGARQQLPQQHGLALAVGQLDADDAAAGDRGGTHRNGAHGACDVVGEADHPRGPCAGLRLEFIKSDHGPRPHLGDLAEDPEIFENGDQHLRVLAQRLFAHAASGAGAIGIGQQRERRQRVLLIVLQVEVGLALLLLPLAGLHLAPGLLDDAGFRRRHLDLARRRRQQARLAPARALGRRLRALAAAQPEGAGRFVFDIVPLDMLAGLAGPAVKPAGDPDNTAQRAPRDPVNAAHQHAPFPPRHAECHDQREGGGDQKHRADTGGRHADTAEPQVVQMR